MSVYAIMPRPLHCFSAGDSGSVAVIDAVALALAAASPSHASQRYVRWCQLATAFRCLVVLDHPADQAHHAKRCDVKLTNGGPTFDHHRSETSQTALLHSGAAKTSNGDFFTITAGSNLNDRRNWCVIVRQEIHPLGTSCPQDGRQYSEPYCHYRQLHDG